MGVQTTLKDIQSGFLSATTHTANNTLIETALNKALDRTDTVDNAMEVDLDMGSNRIINLGDAINNKDAVTLDQLNSLVALNSSGLVALSTETQKGSSVVADVTTFSGLAYTVGGNNLHVFRNGVKQYKGRDYLETSSTSITWIETPNASDDLDFFTNISTTSDITSSSAITHVEDGITYNLATYLADRLAARKTEVQLGSAAVAKVFTLATITYTVGGNTLEVWRNGVRLEKDVDYTETTISTVTIIGNVYSTDRFAFTTVSTVANGVADSANIIHTEDSTDYNLATYLQNRHVVNVLDYGVVGDGATDITATVNSIFTGLGGGTVVFPKAVGAYMVNALTSLKPNSNTKVVIEEGAVIKAITNSSDNYAVIQISNADNVTICGGGKIQGERSTHTGGTGEGGMCIRTDNSSNILIEGLEITEGWGDGVYIGGIGGGCSNVQIINNRIHNNRRNNISVVDGNNGVIANNIIYNANGTAPETGIDLEPGKNENVRNWAVSGNTVYNNGSGITAVTPWEPAVSIVRDIVIAGNTVYNNTADGIAVGRMLACVVSGNISNSNGTTGIQVTSGVHRDTNSVPGNGVTSDIIVSGNACYGNTTSGIYINGNNTYTDISNIQVAGNVCGGNTTYGIRVDRTAGQTLKNISIVGNTTKGNTLSGIYLNRTVDCLVDANIVTDNTTKGIEVTGSAGDTVGLVCSNNLVKDNTDVGIQLFYPNKSSFIGNKINGNDKEGIYSYEAHDSVIANNVITGNSQLTDATYNGIYIDRSDDCVISGNVIRHDGGANQHKYGIEIEATALRNLVTDNNIISSGKTGNFLSNTATTVIRNNLGYVTESHGTSSAIATGATIAHGLAATPTAVTLLAQSTGPSDIYATVDGTNITVNYTGGGTEVFYWTARV